MLSLTYSEVLFFNGNSNEAIFIGLWVPSILCFGIYFNLINKKTMIDFIPYFAGLITLLFGVAFSYAVSDGCNFKGDQNK